MRNSFESFQPYTEKSVAADSGYSPNSIKSVPEHILERSRRARAHAESK